jgi:hypothetical protein
MLARSVTRTDDVSGTTAAADESTRARLIADIARLIREPTVPEGTRLAGLTLIGWLARRRPDELPHTVGVEEARKSRSACSSEARERTTNLSNSACSSEAVARTPSPSEGSPACPSEARDRARLGAGAHLARERTTDLASHLQAVRVKSR